LGGTGHWPVLSGYQPDSEGALRMVSGRGLFDSSVSCR
jgi:hypothetical protein